MNKVKMWGVVAHTAAFMTLTSTALAQSETSSAAAEAPAEAAAAPESVAEPEPEAPPAEASDEGDDSASWADFAEAASADEKIFQTRIYGYIDSYFEQVANTPAGVDAMGNTITEPNAYEFDVLNLHLFVQGTIYNKYRYFLNIVGSGSGGVTDEGIAVRNAWVEAPLWGDKLILRAGKTYRRFGLYNEILDAVPTFIGIEAPELFDGDHLMLTRTTNLMLHGSVGVAEGTTLNYSLASGNDERTRKAIPFGGDVHVTVGSTLKIGTSFYWTGGDAVPTRDVGDGSPDGGVLNWMARDEYYVVGGYGELNYGGFILQAAYWHAEHDATRDEDAVRALADAGLNQRQLERFFENGDPMGAVRTDADYAVQTFYTRFGYELPLFETVQVIPYGQVDWFSNPETIASKDFGGDNEAGLAEDGEFWKVTIGSVIRPIPQVALKIDGSAHVQTFNGETFIYPEIRTSLSYLWDLEL